MRRAALTILPLALAACSKGPPPAKPVETEVPADLRQPAAPAAANGAGPGTPLKDRVATIGVLNKRNNVQQDLTLKPGEMKRIGDVIVALRSCERTAPWEMPRETGAFVQVWVKEGRQAEGFAKVFSGWLFKQSPSLNVVEHPVYDVWVKDCAMRFPGEEFAPSDGKGEKAGAKPSAKPSATAAPSASPAPSATPANDATA